MPDRGYNQSHNDSNIQEMGKKTNTSKRNNQTRIHNHTKMTQSYKKKVYYWGFGRTPNDIARQYKTNQLWAIMRELKCIALNYFCIFRTLLNADKTSGKLPTGDRSLRETR